MSESWHLFQTSEIYKTWAILHLFGQPSHFHSQPWQVISAFTSCVGALSTFSTCHLDFFHQDHGRLDDDDAAGGGTVFSVSSIRLQKLPSLFEILEWTVFFSDIKTETGFPAKTTWPNKFTCPLKRNSRTLVRFLEEKVLNADSNLMVEQLLDPRWPTKKISLYWATRLEQVLLSETSLIKGKPKHRQYRLYRHQRITPVGKTGAFIDGQLKHLWFQHLPHHPNTHPLFFSASHTRPIWENRSSNLRNTWRLVVLGTHHFLNLIPWPLWSLSRKVRLRSNRCLGAFGVTSISEDSDRCDWLSRNECTT